MLYMIAINSLLKTNIGAGPIYCIYILITLNFTDDIEKRAENIDFADRIVEPMQ